MTLAQLTRLVLFVLLTGLVVFCLSRLAFQPPPVRCIEAQLSLAPRVTHVPRAWHLVPVDPLYI